MWQAYPLHRNIAWCRCQCHEEIHQGFEGRKIQISGRKVEIDEKLTAKVTSLSMDGVKLYRDTKMLDGTVKRFPKNEKKRAKLAKVDKNNYDMGKIKTIWQFVLVALMKYVTLDGRYTRAFAHHFVLLNHFRHKVETYFSFFLLALINVNIKYYRKEKNILSFMGVFYSWSMNTLKPFPLPQLQFLKVLVILRMMIMLAFPLMRKNGILRCKSLILALTFPWRLVTK